MTTNSTNSSQETTASTTSTEQLDPLMFDEKLNGMYRDTGNRAFLNVPELRSVIVIFDYYRNLNDSPDVSKGLWLSAEGKGPEKTPDSIIGSLGALQQSAAHVFDEAFALQARLQQGVTSTANELLKKQTELKALEEKLLEKKNELKALEEGN